MKLLRICDVGASLMSQSYFWQDDPPIFLSGPENENFTVAPKSTSCFVTLRNPSMEIGEIIEDILLWLAQSRRS